MAVLHWVWVIVGAWLVLSCAVAIMLGLVVRARESLEAPERRCSVSVDELEAMLAAE